ncbi:hypothetical protein DFH11DRAFT_146740 [Phellopilus nigrolimitatus]|nr:hypothetical protein DFH11DRAFT_146740 [Phellopilus nigrolimitatus]
MLVPNDSKLAEEQGDEAEVSSGPEHPPPYAPSSSETSPAETSASGARPLPQTPNLPASNFSLIKRDNESIKGTYVVDPGLRIPDELVPSALDFDGEDGRKNLQLESKNGSISTVVWLVDSDSGEEQKRRALIDVKSQSGSISVKMNAITPRQYALSAYSRSGSVSVALPSSFVGPVTMFTVHGSVSLSNSVTSRLITFSEIDGKGSCFIGDIKAANYTGIEGWTGSTLDIGSQSGRLKLSFVDEEQSTEGSGFFSRLFRGFA